MGDLDFGGVRVNGRRVTSLSFGLGFDLSDIGDAFADVVDAVVDSIAWIGKHLDTIAEVMIIAGIVICTGGSIAVAGGLIPGKSLIVILAIGSAYTAAGTTLKAISDKYGADVTAAVQWAQNGAHSATDALRKLIDEMPAEEKAALISSQDYRIAINLLNDYGAHPERTAGMPTPSFYDANVDVAAILRRVDSGELTGLEAYQALANSGHMAESAIERAKWEESLRNSPIGALIRAAIAENSKSAVVMLGVARDLEKIADTHPSNEAELRGLAATLRERAKTAGVGATSSSTSSSTTKKLVVGTVVAGGAAAAGLAWYASKHGLTMVQALRRIFR